jgi:hypothetical protein
MGDEEKNNEQEKGFTVRDKRFTAKKEEGVASQTQEERKKEETRKQKEDISRKDAPLPEVTFTNLIISFSTSVLIQLGEIQDPLTQKSEENLPLAKQTIDLIGMLKEKTKENLTPEEEKLIEAVLYDLRMRYVEAVG